MNDNFCNNNYYFHYLLNFIYYIIIIRYIFKYPEIFLLFYFLLFTHYISKIFIVVETNKIFKVKNKLMIYRYR